MRQRIRDPLHNLIEFDLSDEFERTMWSVMQARPFQRLRRVKQLGFSDLVYPGATHSRFAHSVGVFHTARRLINLIKESGNWEPSKAHQALAAALLHDVGHGAFSHAFEYVGKKLNLEMAKHEIVSSEIIKNSEVKEVLNNLGSGFASDVSDVIDGSGKKTIYSAVVSSQFDADRLDYMQRDRLMAGTHHAMIDFEWLLANIEIGKVPYVVDDQKVGDIETFVLGPKSIFGAEAYVLGLFQLYPTVYFHKTTRGFEKIFVELLIRVFTFIQDGSLEKTGLPANHPFVLFAKEPEKLNRALDLDDTVIWGALAMLRESSDYIIAFLSKALSDRCPYKCFDIRVKLASKLWEDGDLDRAVNKVRDKLTEWSKANSVDVPRFLFDEALRSPYKSSKVSPGVLDRIQIRSSDGSLRDLGEFSRVVSAIEPFKLNRAYFIRGDMDAYEFAERCVKEELEQ